MKPVWQILSNSFSTASKTSEINKEEVPGGGNKAQCGCGTIEGKKVDGRIVHEAFGWLVGNDVEGGLTLQAVRECPRHCWAGTHFFVKLQSSVIS